MAKKKDKEKNYSPTITNRRAKFEYHLEAKFDAGIMLSGTEVKSLRNSKVQLAEAFCLFKGDELFIRDLHISPYTHGNLHNLDPRRDRKLLLSRRELDKIKEEMDQQGFTIIPTKLYFNERNIAKVQIALAKGKKLFDKRNDIKEKDTKRIMDRELRS